MRMLHQTLDNMSTLTRLQFDQRRHETVICTDLLKEWPNNVGKDSFLEDFFGRMEVREKRRGGKIEE